MDKKTASETGLHRGACRGGLLLQGQGLEQKASYLGLLSVVIANETERTTGVYWDM